LGYCLLPENPKSTYFLQVAVEVNPLTLNIL
jgi:hypothetical protein